MPSKAKSEFKPTPPVFTFSCGQMRTCCGIGEIGSFSCAPAHVKPGIDENCYKNPTVDELADIMKRRLDSYFKHWKGIVVACPDQDNSNNTRYAFVTYSMFLKAFKKIGFKDKGKVKSNHGDYHNHLLMWIREDKK